MNLDKYKQRLREEILEFGRVHGVRKTCREAGISLSVWHRIKEGGNVPVESLQKYLEMVKNCLNVSKTRNK